MVWKTLRGSKKAAVAYEKWAWQTNKWLHSQSFTHDSVCVCAWKRKWNECCVRQINATIENCNGLQWIYQRHLLFCTYSSCTTARFNIFIYSIRHERVRFWKFPATAINNCHWTMVSAITLDLVHFRRAHKHTYMKIHTKVGHDRIYQNSHASRAFFGSEWEPIINKLIDINWKFIECPKMQQAKFCLFLFQTHSRMDL